MSSNLSLRFLAVALAIVFWSCSNNTPARDSTTTLPDQKSGDILVADHGPSGDVGRAKDSSKSIDQRRSDSRPADSGKTDSGSPILCPGTKSCSGSMTGDCSCTWSCSDGRTYDVMCTNSSGQMTCKCQSGSIFKLCNMPTSTNACSTKNCCGFPF